MLRKAELDRLGIEAILPDLERQLLLSSVEPSLAIWLKTNTPDFESTDPSDSDLNTKSIPGHIYFV